MIWEKGILSSSLELFRMMRDFRQIFWAPDFALRYVRFERCSYFWNFFVVFGLNDAIKILRFYSRTNRLGDCRIET
jgi:hypothetical protein